MSKDYNKVLQFITGELAAVLYMVNDDIKSKTSEIRIRVNKPLCLTINNKTVFVGVNGKVGDFVPDQPFIPDKKTVNDCFMLVCNNSVYAYENELANAFVTLSNGSRVGIFGDAVYSCGSVTAYKNVTSLNYRIPREVIGCALPIKDTLLLSKGVIICGPPASSKTTILRDSIRMLAGADCGYKRVAVVDSRNEIAAIYDGIVGMDLGICSDVINLPSTEHGIETAIRVMNPEYIAVDEIVSKGEINALLKGAKCGSKLIATMHAGTVKEIMLKKSLQILIENDVVEHAVFVEKAGGNLKIININKELYN